MDELSNEQFEFLRIHNVPLEKVFNAKGYSREQYRNIMKKQGKIVASNVTPCSAFGHTLRTRSGHCIECNPAYLAFQMRNDFSGIIYIAGSKLGKIIKVGYSKEIEIRNESLNRTMYAGFNDWKIIFGLFSAKAGEIENLVRPELSNYLKMHYYEHDGKTQIAKETYSCSYKKAKTIILSICKKCGYDYNINKNGDDNEFNFRNLIKIQT